MYFSAKDKGEMMSMIYNWPAHEVLYEFRMSIEENIKFPFCLSSFLYITSSW